MKKILYLFLLTTAISMVSCSRDDENRVFDKSASERIRENIALYKSLLASSQEGWVLEYYIGGKNIIYGGFPYLLTFTESQVTATAASRTAFQATSSYSVLNNAGPTLVFEDYNVVFHQFGTPSGNRQSGNQADVEFLFLSHTEDEILLKGKKYGIEMRLLRNKKPTAEVLTNLNGIHRLLATKSLVGLSVKGNDVPFSISNRSFTYTPDSSNQNEKKSVPFIITETGIRFKETVTIDNQVFQELTYDASSNNFKSDDGQVMLLFSYDLTFDLVNTTWNIDALGADVSDEFKQAFLGARQGVDILYPGEELGEAIQFGKVDVDTGIYWFSYENRATGRGYAVEHMLKFSGTRNPSEIQIVANPEGRNRNYRFYAPLAPFLKKLTDNAPYMYELDDPTTPTRVKFTSKANPAYWFYITR